ncbi:MAG: hypothetical protein HQM16_05605 [Deltaproteobacteria bacterium]|nr:hypothetical protein [Deltaproteobacteria bacterium]
MTDTDPKTEAIYAKMIMAKSGVERLKMGLSMFDMSKKIVIASIRATGNTDNMTRQLLIRFYQDVLDSDTIDKITALASQQS